MKNYIHSSALKQEINELVKSKKLVDPLRYKEDMPFRRRKYLFLRSSNYVKKYKTYTF